MKGMGKGIKFWLFNKLVFDKVKQKLGLDKAKYLFYGAAPMSERTRGFFFSLNLFLNNVFGMSETSGPMSFLYQQDYSSYNLKSAGRIVEGAGVHFEANGEICFWGRNIFMGYLKNEQATKEALDGRRLLHSGDQGELDDNSNLLITGRIKEIIVTAGGENVAPVVIEEIIKERLPFISHPMLVGDNRKFIACLLTFRVTTLASELPGENLSQEAIEYLRREGIDNITTVHEALECPEIKKVIEKGMCILSNHRNC